MVSVPSFSAGMALAGTRLSTAWAQRKACELGWIAVAVDTLPCPHLLDLDDREHKLRVLLGWCQDMESLEHTSVSKNR